MFGFDQRDIRTSIGLATVIINILTQATVIDILTCSENKQFARESVSLALYLFPQTANSKSSY